MTARPPDAPLCRDRATKSQLAIRSKWNGNGPHLALLNALLQRRTSISFNADHELAAVSEPLHVSGTWRHWQGERQLLHGECRSWFLTHSRHRRKLRMDRRRAQARLIPAVARPRFEAAGRVQPAGVPGRAESCGANTGRRAGSSAVRAVCAPRDRSRAARGSCASRCARAQSPRLATPRATRNAMGAARRLLGRGLLRRANFRSTSRRPPSRLSPKLRLVLLLARDGRPARRSCRDVASPGRHG